LSDLLRVAPSNPELDLDSIYAFLMIGWVPTPHSMLRGVEKLAPGTFIEIRAGAFSQTEYYDIPHSSASLQRSPNSAPERIAEYLDRAVDRGQRIGGRWGSFLSGGVDSSSVVSSLARSNRGAFPTYFGGFDADLNQYLPNPEEPAMSKLVAERFGTLHRQLWLGPQATETMPEIVAALEEPVSDGGCIVIAEGMKAARWEGEGLMAGFGGLFLFPGGPRPMVLNLLRYLGFAPDPAWRVAIWLSGLPMPARHARVSQLHFDIERLFAARGALD